MFNTLKSTIAAAGVLAFSASMAFAVTVTSTDVIPTTPVANPLADSISGTVLENTTGSVAGERLSPWTSVLADISAAPYTAILADSSATYSITGNKVGEISLLWGSPDTYNDLVITLSGAGGSVTINGGDPALQPVFPGPAGTGRGVSLVTITDTAGFGFDSITLSSTGLNAFEFANLTLAPIPLPASLPLLIAGLGGVAFVRSRRKAS